MTPVDIVTVTYGNRRKFLYGLLSSIAADTRIRNVHIVDNNAAYSVQAFCAALGLNKVTVLHSPYNTGSAYAFKIGIEHALASGAGRIWLLDDDTVPHRDALDALLTADKNISTSRPSDTYALVSFRPEHQADIAAGVPIARCFPRPGSFLGFHFLDIPYKLWRRTRMGRPGLTAPLPSIVPVQAAPYAGLFFHAALVQHIGLPNPSFVLYADDTEFTSRIPRMGGAIFLVTDSLVQDMEMSWNIKARFSTSFRGWLCGTSDTRAYYGIRNQTHYESTVYEKSLSYRLNLGIYCCMMAFCALHWGRMPRFRIFAQALLDGYKGRLGRNPGYPLP